MAICIHFPPSSLYYNFVMNSLETVTIIPILTDDEAAPERERALSKVTELVLGRARMKILVWVIPHTGLTASWTGAIDPRGPRTGSGDSSGRGWAGREAGHFLSLLGMESSQLQSQIHLAGKLLGNQTS